MLYLSNAPLITQTEKYRKTSENQDLNDFLLMYKNEHWLELSPAI